MRAHLALALLVPSLALAANYEVPLNEVDSEDEIIMLEQNGDISTDTADILLDMIREGVDLNSATRDELYDLPGLNYEDVDAIILYRTNKGRIEDPTELVGAGAISADQLLVITPFIRLTPGAVRLPVSGKYRLSTATSNGDFLTNPVTAPPIVLEGTMKFPLNLSAGFLGDTTRRQPGTPRYESARDTLVADDFNYHPNVRKAWAMWKASQARVVVGSFNIGFAERLTLDNTNRTTPSGIYQNEDWRRPRTASLVCRSSGSTVTAGGTELICAGGGKSTYIAPDFVPLKPNFRGVAGSVEDLEFAQGQKMSMFGFLSYQTRGLYQYALYDKRVCDDPRELTANCSSPIVYRADDFSGAHLVYATLPNVYDELIGGGHVDYKPNDRVRIGLTGYGATNFFHDAPMQLDFQEWAHTPRGGPFGAIGLDGRAQFGKIGLYLEATRSFDSIKGGPTSTDPKARYGGGGYGIEQRSVYSPRGHEVELSFRYYDDQFVNPYARPVSAPDVTEGQRARNELGSRLRYVGKLPADFLVTTRADFWVLPYTNPREGPAGLANLDTMVRLDYEGYKKFKPAVWFEMRNRNLASSVHGQCSAGTTGAIYIEGDPNFACSGDSYKFVVRGDFNPLGRLLALSAQGAFRLLDDPRYGPTKAEDRFRQEVLAWGEVRSQPWDFLQLQLRSTFRWEDISTDYYLEKSLWTYLEGTYILNRNFRFSLRYDLYAFLDKRDSTLGRVPNPEHRFFLDVAAGF